MSNPGCSGCQAWLSKPSLFPTSSIISIHTAFSSLAKHFAYLLFSNLYKPSLLILIYLFIYSKLPFLLSLINIIQLYLHSSTAFPVTHILHSFCSLSTYLGLHSQVFYMCLHYDVCHGICLLRVMVLRYWTYKNKISILASLKKHTCC